MISQISIKKNQPLNFRSDINGLRAWAVVIVIFYHFKIAYFSAGFVGVDIFFVISGFLMTSIIITNIENNRFSLINFYVARAHRILPALIFLCAVLLVFGWWFLVPTDYLKITPHVATSIAFISNILFNREDGYFDTDSHEKWLLHTWSLSVEWQFYLLLPLFIFFLWKIKQSRYFLTSVIFISFTISLGLCITYTAMKPSASFFLLPYRAWEMLAGGLVFLLQTKFTPSSLQRKTIEGLGISLIAASIAFFMSKSQWPGWHALIPVAGTALVLAANRSPSMWTGHFLAQWLGTRSYSLYLWHWPLAVSLRYAGRETEPMAIAAALTMTVLLGHLSYHWIETPARVWLGRSRNFGVAVMVGTACLLASACGAIVMLNGVSGRFTPEIDAVSRGALDKNPRRAACHALAGGTSPSCQYGTGPVRAVVLGDSHADALVSAVAASVADNPAERQGSVLQWSYSACPIIQGAHRTAADPLNQCADFVDWAIQKLKTIPADVPVIVVNRHGQYLFGKPIEGPVNVPWVYFSKPYATSEPAFQQEYAQHLTQTACTLAQGHPVYLVRPIPEMNVNVPSLARATVWGQHKQAGVTLDAYHQRNDVVWQAQDAAQKQCNIHILDPIPYLCKNGNCPGIANGAPIYYDDNHLSEAGNKLLLPMFDPLF